MPEVMPDGYVFPDSSEPGLPEVFIDNHGCMTLLLDNVAVVVRNDKIQEFVARVNELAGPQSGSSSNE